MSFLRKINPLLTDELDLVQDVSGFVPFTGATQNIDLNSRTITQTHATIAGLTNTMQPGGYTCSVDGYGYQAVATKVGSIYSSYARIGTFADAISLSYSTFDGPYLNIISDSKQLKMDIAGLNLPGDTYQFLQADNPIGDIDPSGNLTWYNIFNIGPNASNFCLNVNGGTYSDWFPVLINDTTGGNPVIGLKTSGGIDNGLFGLRADGFGGVGFFQAGNGFRVEAVGGMLGPAHMSLASINDDAELITTDFDILRFGQDSYVAFNGFPLRLSWDSTNQYVWLDDSSYNRLTLSANLVADLVSATSFSGGSFSGTQATLMPNADVTQVPLLVMGCSAAANKSCTFTYRAPATFTVTTGSPGKLNVTNTFVANECVRLSTTGTLPTEVNTTTVYFIRNPTGSQVELSTTSGGASINIVSGAGTGTHTITMLCKVTTATAHGRSARDPILTAGGTPMPAGISAGTQYYVSPNGLTATEFYPMISTNAGASSHVAITSAGSGAPFVYGHNADLARWMNSAGNRTNYIDKYGNLYGNLLTMPWRIGHIPNDSNYSGMWFGSTPVTSPDATNYTFLGDGINAFLNAISGSVFLRIGNTTYGQLNSTGLTVTGDCSVTSGKVFKVNSVQVITAQQTGLGATLASRTAAATYGTTEQTMLQEAHDKIRLLETRLKTHGLVAT
jgi:hypothetical protein